MTIEKLKKQDIKKAARLHNKGLLMQNPPGKSSLKETEKKLTKYHCFVYKEHKKIIGLITFEKIKKDIHLKFICVSKLRKGIGRKLIEKVINYAKKNEIRFIHSSVSTIDKRVVNFYKRLGFNKYGKSKTKSGAELNKIKLDLKNKKPKVLVAMSGGVDSSVAALLLKRKGYEVIGAFMINWSNTKNDYGECAWRAEKRTAQKVAAQLGIQLKTINSEKSYKKQVVEKMIKEYKRGITPNPDIDCNQKIKFPFFIKEAKKLSCDFIATGHYARIKKTRKGFKLLRGKDEFKDQSYFLYKLGQKELSKTLFPVGELKKKKVRKIAKENNLPNYNKKGTVGICFIGKIDLKSFLKKRIKPRKGPILNPKGEKIGEHDGIYYYTIGERLRERIGLKFEKAKTKDQRMQRWYVAKKIPRKNTLVAAPEGHPLNLRKELLVKNPHWITESPLSKKKKAKLTCRIRHVGELQPCTLKIENGKIRTTLKKPITGVSQGQAIVLYKGKEVLGGGVIRFE